MIILPETVLNQVCYQFNLSNEESEEFSNSVRTLQVENIWKAIFLYFSQEKSKPTQKYLQLQLDKLSNKLTETEGLEKMGKIIGDEISENPGFLEFLVNKQVEFVGGFIEILAGSLDTEQLTEILRLYYRQLPVIKQALAAGKIDPKLVNFELKK